MEPKKQVGRLTQAQRHFSRNGGLSPRPWAQRERDKEKRRAPVSRGLSGERSEKPQGGGPRKPLGGFLRSRTA